MEYYKQFGGTSASHLTKQTMGAARPSVYQINGGGRDSYINNDNGGLYRRNRPASAMTVGSFRTVAQKDFNLADLGTKRANYHFNGTGRDSYIG